MGDYQGTEDPSTSDRVEQEVNKALGVKRDEPQWARVWRDDGQGWGVQYLMLEQHTKVEIEVHGQCSATLFNPDIGIEVSAGKAVYDANRCWLRAGNAKFSVTMDYQELIKLKAAIVTSLGLNIVR